MWGKIRRENVMHSLRRMHDRMNICINELTCITSVAIFPLGCRHCVCAISYSGFLPAVSRCSRDTGCQPGSMPYVVIRTKFQRQRDHADVYPHLFVRLSEAKRRARHWKIEDMARRRRVDRFVYSVHKVCLVPDFTTTLWHI